MVVLSCMRTFCSVLAYTGLQLHAYYSSKRATEVLLLGLNYQRCFLSTSSIFLWLSNYHTSLVDLDLPWNLLAGSIPDAFGHMSSLAYLSLSYNQLEGSLPDLTIGDWDACPLPNKLYKSRKFTGTHPYPDWNKRTELELAGRLDLHA
ncbi:unnamed protein product [Prunus brigantina]